MIERGEVKPDDPVGKFLPPGVKVPSRNGRQITLLDLSMQISGLPRLPDNLAPADPMNPYADYGAAKLSEFLSHYTLTRDIGEKYEYSNLGAGLLGYALARKAGMSYEELVRRRILDPLGMTSTSITLSADQKKRLAAGYNAGLEPAKNWDFDAETPPREARLCGRSRSPSCRSRTPSEQLLRPRSRASRTPDNPKNGS